jgi:hypothetical protein
VPNANPQQVANGLIAAYCPILAASNLPTYLKYAELRRGSGGASVGTARRLHTRGRYRVGDPCRPQPRLSRPAAVYRKANLPANDGRSVPTDLVAHAENVIDDPHWPVPSSSAGQIARAHAAKDQTASPANLANALILSYCQLVTKDQAGDSGTRRAWLLDFSAQVQALQQRALT